MSGSAVWSKTTDPASPRPAPHSRGTHGGQARWARSSGTTKSSKRLPRARLGSVRRPAASGVLRTKTRVRDPAPRQRRRAPRAAHRRRRGAGAEGRDSRGEDRCGERSAGRLPAPPPFRGEYIYIYRMEEGCHGELRKCSLPWSCICPSEVRFPCASPMCRRARGEAGRSALWAAV